MAPPVRGRTGHCHSLLRPTRVLARSNEWLFNPGAPYERSGDVDQVVFPCGWLLDDNGDTPRVYYGAADTSRLRSYSQPHSAPGESLPQHSRDLSIARPLAARPSAGSVARFSASARQRASQRRSGPSERPSTIGAPKEGNRSSHRRESSRIETTTRRRRADTTRGSRPGSYLSTPSRGSPLCSDVLGPCSDVLSHQAETREEMPATLRSRRADSNRGPLHYESRAKRAASPLQSLQALPTSQNRELLTFPWVMSGRVAAAGGRRR